MPRFAVNLTMMFNEVPFLDRLGSDGYAGCEYRPRARAEDGLGWVAPYRRAVA